MPRQPSTPAVNVEQAEVEEDEVISGEVVGGDEMMGEAEEQEGYSSSRPALPF